MTDVKYTITFFSEWHTGSGLTSGSDLDALVLKDKDGLPFIPGKTLKGLLKAAASDINDIKCIDSAKDAFISEVFGFFDGEEKQRSEVHTKGKAYFTDAGLSEGLKAEIFKNDKQLMPFLFRNIASTAIKDDGVAKKHSLRKMETCKDDGVAKKHSLRKMETCIPLCLEAKILFLDDAYIERMEECMRWIKRMGLSRHRGFGRCKFEIIKE